MQRFHSARPKAGSTRNAAFRGGLWGRIAPAEETHAADHFVKRLVFSHDVAPIFGPYLCAPLTRAVYAIATKLKVLQSGHLNFYLALLGELLVVILALALY
jgi:hydrogenase-4 component B